MSGEDSGAFLKKKLAEEIFEIEEEKDMNYVTWIHRQILENTWTTWTEWTIWTMWSKNKSIFLSISSTKSISSTTISETWR